MGKILLKKERKIKFAKSMKTLSIFTKDTRQEYLEWISKVSDLPLSEKKKSKKVHQIILSLLKADKENFDSIVDAILLNPQKRNQSHSCKLHGVTINQILKSNIDNRVAGTY